MTMPVVMPENIKYFISRPSEQKALIKKYRTNIIKEATSMSFCVELA